jgi:hypothetical protein
MKRISDKKKKAAKKIGSGSTETGTIPADVSPAPIFVSYIYDFVKTETETGLSGDGGGRPGTIGGPIENREPMYIVYTYPFLPPMGPPI